MGSLVSGKKDTDLYISSSAAGVGHQELTSEFQVKSQVCGGMDHGIQTE